MIITSMIIKFKFVTVGTTVLPRPVTVGLGAWRYSSCAGTQAVTDIPAQRLGRDPSPLIVRSRYYEVLIQVADFNHDLTQ